MAEQTVQMISISKITPNPWNRTEFDEEGLKELAASIDSVGVLVPILVRPISAVSHQRSAVSHIQYQLIAGERRWRACQRLKLETVPALVRELSDREAQEEALIENIQREDLDAITEAQGYERLVKDMKVPQNDLAKRVGKSKGYISTQIRILSLPKEIWPEFSRENLTRTHAVQLLKLNDPKMQIRLAKNISRLGWSAAETEKRVNRVLGISKERPHTAPSKGRGSNGGRGIFPFKLQGLKDGIRLEGKTPKYYELVIPITWRETDLEAVLSALLQTVQDQRKAWQPLARPSVSAVRERAASVDGLERALKQAKADGRSDQAALEQALGRKVTPEMIENLKKFKR